MAWGSGRSRGPAKASHRKLNTGWWGVSKRPPDTRAACVAASTAGRATNGLAGRAARHEEPATHGPPAGAQAGARRAEEVVGVPAEGGQRLAAGQAVDAVGVDEGRDLRPGRVAGGVRLRVGPGEDLALADALG